MGRLVVLITCVFLAGFLYGAYALLARFVLHGPVTGRSLFVSVQSASGSAGQLLDDQGRCRRARSPREWRCSVSDSAGSGGVSYRVRVKPSNSCWDGRLTGNYGEGEAPKSISGCVYRWQWTLLDLL